MKTVEYEQSVENRASKHYYYDTVSGDLVHGVMGAANEAGELLQLVKKQLFYGKPFTREQILDEAGDVLWFLTLTIRTVGSTLEEVMEINNAKLEARHGASFNKEAVTSKM